MPDREQIRQLVARYAVAVDTRDLDTLVSLFVDDVQIGRERVGRDALRKFFAGELDVIERSFLLVGTHVIELDGDAATGVVYCHGQIHRDGGWVDQAIRYDDTYARRDGTWLFVRRKHTVLFER